MIITTEIYDQIRKLYYHEGLSKRGIAKKLGISRNTVDKYFNGAFVPWERQAYSKRESPIVTDDVKNFITECLVEDEIENITKQKHPAHRIYERLVHELEFKGGESTIRRLVKELKGSNPKTFLPLAFEPGEATQIDWGEATIYLKSQRMKVHLFCMRLCYSDQPFVYACLRANMESFLESHVRGFEFLGGVTKRLIFDNAKVAVQEGYGSHAKEQKYYTAFRAHYAFETIYCNPGEGHEKGLVEGLVGWTRRNILVPVPRCESIDELNQMLADRCREYSKHQVRDKAAQVGIMYEMEKPFFTPLPIYRYSFAKTTTARVNEMCLVRFEGNRYSAPAAYAGKEVTVKGLANWLEIYYRAELIAKHPRNYGKGQVEYKIEHYLDDLLKKPRALSNAAPLKYGLPEDVSSWLERLPGGTEDILKVIRLFKTHTPETIYTIIRKQGYPQNPEILIQSNSPSHPSTQTPLPVMHEIKVYRPNLGLYDKMLVQEVVV